MAPRYHLFHRSTPFKFRNGEEIPERAKGKHRFAALRLQIAYETWGHLNAKKDNVILLQPRARLLRRLFEKKLRGAGCPHLRMPALMRATLHQGGGRTATSE